MTNSYLVKNAAWYPQIEGGTFNLLGESSLMPSQEANRILHTRQQNYPDGEIEFLMQRGEGESVSFAWVPMSSIQTKTPDGWVDVQQFQRFDRDAPASDSNESEDTTEADAQ